MRGVTGTGAWSQRIRVEDAPPLAEHRALPILWARARIDALTRTGFAEPDAEARAEILALGLHHRLLTRFTSFVAVSKIVRNRHEPGVDVDQPLPMPAGVSDAAVGVGAEPGLLGLAIAVLLALGVRAALRGRAREPMHSMDRAA